MTLRNVGYIAVIESASFILLLIAMVVKYGFDEPPGVEIMGPVHSVLFL